MSAKSVYGWRRAGDALVPSRLRAVVSRTGPGRRWQPDFPAEARPRVMRLHF